MPPNLGPYYAPPVDGLAPARRASLLMFLISGLLLLSSTCMLCFPYWIKMLPPDQVDQMRHQQAVQQTQMPLERVAFIEGLGMVGIGLPLLILGVLVRRGGRVATIVSIALVGLLTLISIVDLLNAFAAPSGPGIIVVFVLIAAVLSLLLAWLIQAARAVKSVAFTQQEAQRLYAAQYWQYQQNLQAYGQGGYGYGTPATPQPPALPQPGPSPQPPPLPPVQE